MRLGKPSGVLDKRVQEVGPERFGIVSVDCAKHRSRWMLCDFYGRRLIEPSTVEHTGPALRAMIDLLRHAVQEHQLGHVLVAVERTGNYHRPMQRACRDAGFEARTVHPFASKKFREAEHPQDKTDDHDLGGIHRATVVGFGLIEQPLDDLFLKLRLLVRHRRDLVRKTAAVQCQIREHLQATLPGLAALFDDDQFWNCSVGMPVARRFASPESIRKLGLAGLDKVLREAGVGFQQRTLEKILTWSEQALPADAQALIQQRIVCDLDDDRLAKKRLIQALELELAGLLASTPYVLLMAIPGINVVSAAEFAGEAGPISHYANPNALSGRAGLFPSRYQSDTVDRRGRMVRAANRRLRAALTQIAENLLTVNDHFRAQAALWKKKNVDRGLQRVRVAKRFTRLAYSMTAGECIVPHPCCREPHHILDKLLSFHLEREAKHAQIRDCLATAAQRLPDKARAGESRTLGARVDKFQTARRPHVQSLASILKEVLAKLLGPGVKSTAEG
jgi:transposase